MKFTSQIATNVEQSEKLIALGLKYETADMHSYRHTEIDNTETWELSVVPYSNMISAANMFNESYIVDHIKPAWSLHRLIEMMPQWLHTIDGSFKLTIDQGKLVCYREISDEVQTFVFGHTSLYDSIIDTIEKLIKEGLFITEYLKD